MGTTHHEGVESLRVLAWVTSVMLCSEISRGVNISHLKHPRNVCESLEMLVHNVHVQMQERTKESPLMMSIIPQSIQSERSVQLLHVIEMFEFMNSCTRNQWIGFGRMNERQASRCRMLRKSQRRGDMTLGPLDHHQRKNTARDLHGQSRLQLFGSCACFELTQGS